MKVSTILAVAALAPVTWACGAKETAAVGAVGAAAAAVAYDDRGANTKVDASVVATANATEMAFRELGIQLTERKNESDGIEVKGMQGEWKVVVDIERDAGDTLTQMEVTVSKDEVNYSKDRAENIMRAIMRHAKH